jgi:serine/threonine protein kinase
MPRSRNWPARSRNSAIQKPERGVALLADPNLSEQAKASVRLASQYDESLKALSQSLFGNWQIRDSVAGRLRWRLFLSSLDIPRQGWKIHLSVTAADAGRFLNEVLPYLMAQTASFKLPPTLEGFVLLNSGNGGRTQVGKAVTVYPANDAACRSLCVGLDERWRSDRAPTVQYDLSPHVGSSVYLRYGALTRHDVIIDPQGRYMPAISTPSGVLVADRRDESGGRPTWAPEPPVECVSNPPNKPLDVRIGSKYYLPLRRIQSTAKGEVHLGACGNTAAPVIIKTALKGVCADIFGLDATDRLANEYHILTFLTSSNGNCLGPVALAFEMGDPAILVSEDIPGTPLYQLPRNKIVRGVAAMMRSVGKLHDLGLAHRDVKLSNAIIAGSVVRLIDFELSCSLNNPQPLIGGTRSYMPPEGPWGRVASSADCYALGVSLVHAVIGYDPARLPLGSGRLIGLLKLVGSHQYVGIVMRLTTLNASLRLTAKAAAEILELIEARDRLSCSSQKPGRRQACRPWVTRAVIEATESIATFFNHSQGYGWRNNHIFSEYICEGINLGAAGIVLGLATIATALGRRELTRDIGPTMKWLAVRNPFPDSHGLFTGNAGVALALCVGAKFGPGCARMRSRSLERLAFAVQGVTELDLFSGAAGVVWAGCLMAEITGNTAFLQIVSPVAERLSGSAQRFGDVIAWDQRSRSERFASPSIGAAHGAAGIALALAVWGTATSDHAARDLACNVFLSLYRAARSGDHRSLRYCTDPSSAPAPLGHWCHGPAGYLWCMLYTFGDEPKLSAPIDWAVGAFNEANLVDTPAFCHGLAGQLELCRMLKGIPRYSILANRRAEQVAAALRLLQQRRDGLTIWSSEDPDVFTPDLWVGFLGPAASLAMSLVPGSEPLFAGNWLRRCSELPQVRA